MLSGCGHLTSDHVIYVISIRVKGLHENSDLSQLAKEIIDKCKLINPNKLPEVEQLLYYLQNRKESEPSKGRNYSRKEVAYSSVLLK